MSNSENIITSDDNNIVNFTTPRLIPKLIDSNKTLYNFDMSHMPEGTPLEIYQFYELKGEDIQNNLSYIPLLLNYLKKSKANNHSGNINNSNENKTINLNNNAYQNSDPYAIANSNANANKRKSSGIPKRRKAIYIHDSYRQNRSKKYI